MASRRSEGESTTIPSFAKPYPFHALIKAQLQNYGLRPQTPSYADVTLAIQKALSPTSNIDPSTIVSTLRNEIKPSLVLGAPMTARSSEHGAKLRPHPGDPTPPPPAPDRARALRAQAGRDAGRAGGWS